MSPFFKVAKPFFDVGVTLAIWTYFTVGYVLFFSPICLVIFGFSRDRQRSFQWLHHRFLKTFFSLLKAITPKLRIDIAEAVTSARSVIVLSNHISYLDPILLASLFPLNKTIVKGRFFKTPIFGWMLKTMGYIPASDDGAHSELMVEQLDNMERYLEAGGVLFVFPEGTRSRNGEIGKFEKGAFRIAKRCKARLKLIFIENTNTLYRPGKFWFNTCVDNTIRISHVTDIDPDYDDESFSVSALMDQVRSNLIAYQSTK